MLAAVVLPGGRCIIRSRRHALVAEINAERSKMKSEEHLKPFKEALKAGYTKIDTDYAVLFKLCGAQVLTPSADRTRGKQALVTLLGRWQSGLDQFDATKECHSGVAAETWRRQSEARLKGYHAYVAYVRGSTWAATGQTPEILPVGYIGSPDMDALAYNHDSSHQDLQCHSSMRLMAPSSRSMLDSVTIQLAGMLLLLFRFII